MIKAFPLPCNNSYWLAVKDSSLSSVCVCAFTVESGREEKKKRQTMAGMGTDFKIPAPVIKKYDMGEEIAR